MRHRGLRHVKIAAEIGFKSAIELRLAKVLDSRGMKLEGGLFTNTSSSPSSLAVRAATIVQKARRLTSPATTRQRRPSASMGEVNSMSMGFAIKGRRRADGRNLWLSALDGSL